MRRRDGNLVEDAGKGRQSDAEPALVYIRSVHVRRLSLGAGLYRRRHSSSSIGLRHHSSRHRRGENGRYGARRRRDICRLRQSRFGLRDQDRGSRVGGRPLAYRDRLRVCRASVSISWKRYATPAGGGIHLVGRERGRWGCGPLHRSIPTDVSELSAHRQLCRSHRRSGPRRRPGETRIRELLDSRQPGPSRGWIFPPRRRVSAPRQLDRGPEPSAGGRRRGLDRRERPGDLESFHDRPELDPRTCRHRGRRRIHGPHSKLGSLGPQVRSRRRSPRTNHGRLLQRARRMGWPRKHRRTPELHISMGPYAPPRIRLSGGRCGRPGLRHRRTSRIRGRGRHGRIRRHGRLWWAGGARLGAPCPQGRAHGLSRWGRRRHHPGSRRLSNDPAGPQQRSGWRYHRDSRRKLLRVPHGR